MATKRSSLPDMTTISPYTGLFTGQGFPPTERAAAGVPFAATFREMRRPLFVVIWLCMWLSAATELGPGQWVSNIFNDVMQSVAQAVIGATGSISTAIAGPSIGWINNRFGAGRVLSIWAILPAALVLISSTIYFVDRARGGYRIERIERQSAV